MLRFQRIPEQRMLAFPSSPAEVRRLERMGPTPQVRLSGKKKIAFDIATKKETVFGARDAIERNLGKSPVYEMPFDFNSSLEARPSRKHGTLQQFFEIFLLLT